MITVVTGVLHRNSIILRQVSKLQHRVKLGVPNSVGFLEILTLGAKKLFSHVSASPLPHLIVGVGISEV